MKKNILIIANITNTHTHRFIHEFQRRKWDIKILSIQPPNKQNIHDFGDLIIQLPTYSIYKVLVKLPFLKYSEFHNINTGVKWYEPYSISSILTYIYLLFCSKGIIKRLNPGAIYTIYLTMNGFLAALSGHHNIISSAAGADISSVNKLSVHYWANHPFFLRFATRKTYKVLGFDKNTFKPMFLRKKCPTDNIIWINHWGVDTHKFSPTTATEKNNSDPMCRFICSRPYRSEFDFESILNALKKIWQSNKNIEFIIATGAKSKKNLTHLTGILKQTDCHNADFIQILNHIDYTELPKVIKKCDVYIDPINIHKHPHTKGWGVSGSLLEAMSCGLIPVISHRPGVEWILPAEANPFMYSDFSDGLLSALQSAIENKDNPAVRQAMRDAVINKANWETNMNEIEHLFLSNIKQDLN